LTEAENTLTIRLDHSVFNEAYDFGAMLKAYTQIKKYFQNNPVSEGSHSTR
jgi:hypothetical protein